MASLQRHAELRALASLLACGAAAFELTINFQMCVNCHEFIKHATAMLGRAVAVVEPIRRHAFARGACSCRDQWRWEEPL